MSWQAGLAQQGFLAPSEVQAAAIPIILQGKNVGVQSYTGSGKVRFADRARAVTTCTVCSDSKCSTLLECCYAALTPPHGSNMMLMLQTLAYLLPILHIAIQRARTEASQVSSTCL